MMRKMKKVSVVVLVALMVLGTSTLAFGASVVLWGGESDKARISEVLDWADQRIGQLNQSKQDNAQKINDLTNQITQLKGQLTDKDNQIAAKQQEVNSKMVELQNKQNEVNQKNIDITALNTQIGQINGSITQLNDTINQLKSERNQYKAQVDTLNTQVTQLSMAKNESDEKLIKARQDMKELRDKADMLYNKYQ